MTIATLGEATSPLDPVGPADLLRLARTPAEQALADAIAAQHARLAADLPELVDGAVVPWAPPIDAGAFAVALAALPGEEPASSTPGWSSAEGVERAVAPLTALHDRLVAGRHERCQIALVEVREPAGPGPFRQRTVWLTIEGRATIADVPIGPDEAVAVAAEQAVDVVPDGRWRGLRIDLIAWGPEELAAQLRRQVAFSPLARADLPLDLVPPYRSYGGTLLDGPERLADEVLSLAGDQLRERSLAWWHAHLALGPVDVAPGTAADLRFACAGLPAFVDEVQAAAAPQYASVLAISGHVLPLTADHLDQLIGLVGGATRSERHEVDTELAAVLAAAGLLRPA